MYVDDLIIAESTQATVDTFKQQLLKPTNQAYQCKDLGAPDRILKMKIARTAGGGLFLSQSLYVKDLLKPFAEHIGAKTTMSNDSITLMYAS